MKIKNVVPKQCKYAKAKGWASWLVNTKPSGVAKLGNKGEKKYFETREEAEAYAAEVNSAQLHNGGASSSKGGTVGDAIEMVVTSYKRRRKEGNVGFTAVRGYIINAECWKEHIGHIKCSDLNHLQIQSVLDGAFGHLARTTKDRKLKQLEKVLELSRAKGWIPLNARNVAERGEYSETSVVLFENVHNKTEDEIRFGPRKEPFDAQLIKDLCNHMLWQDERVNKERERIAQKKHGKIGHNQPPKPIKYRNFGTILSFAFQTGLRFSEQAALRWSDVDLDSKEITVSCALPIIGEGDQVGVGTTKAKLLRKDTSIGSGIRYVPITPALHKLLVEWKLKSNFSKDEDLVFPTNVGTWNKPSHNWRRRIMHAACDAVGIDRIRWHDARHFFASMLLNAYSNNWGKIADLLGHDSTDFTRRQYGHWVKKTKADKQADADQLGDAMGF